MSDIQETSKSSVSFNYIVLKYNKTSDRCDVVGLMNAERRCYLDLSGEVKELTEDMVLIMRSTEMGITTNRYTVLEWSHNQDHGTFDVTQYQGGNQNSITKYVGKYTIRITPEQYAEVEYKLGKCNDEPLRVLGFSILIGRKFLEYKLKKTKKVSEDTEIYVDFTRLVYNEHGILLGLTNKKATHYVSLWDGILPIKPNYTLTSYKIHHSKYRLKFGFTKWPSFEIEEHERLQLSPNYTYQRNITSIYEVHVSKEDIYKYEKELHYPNWNKAI